MKKNVLSALAGAFLLAATVQAAAASQPSPFAEANAKYQAGDFQAAADLYQKTLKTGRATSAVYYNLGNASLRLGEKGEALLYYRRALKAAPRDKDLQWNIHVLQGALQDRIEESASGLPLLLLHGAADIWTLDETGFFFTGALAFLALLAFADLALPAFQALSSFLRPLVLALLLVSAVLFGFKWWDTKDPRAVVLDKTVNAFYGPSDKETKAFVLHEGAEGRILDSSGDWVYITLQNKNTGWIRKNSCEIV